MKLELLTDEEIVSLGYLAASFTGDVAKEDIVKAYEVGRFERHIRAQDIAEAQRAKTAWGIVEWLGKSWHQIARELADILDREGVPRPTAESASSE